MATKDDEMPEEAELSRFSPTHEVNGKNTRVYDIIDRSGSSKREIRRVKRPFFVPAFFGYDAEMEDDDDSIIKVLHSCSLKLLVEVPI